MSLPIKLTTWPLFWMFAVLLGCDSSSNRPMTLDAPESRRVPETVKQFSFVRPEHRFGTHFDLSSTRHHSPPYLREIALPDRPGATAIWGSTGRDHLGRIYFGVASSGIDNPSAYLLRFDPNANAVTSLGDVNGKLDELGVRKRLDHFETQVKIHSKICQASDGYLYFASQDETDELGDGSRNPKFGGRLLRIDPLTDQWKSVVATPEALIAVATQGRYVYALGYFGHVLYRYDTRDASVQSIHVGSFQGHISRNLMVDHREHAYVVRVRPAADHEEGEGISVTNGVRVRSSLVEWTPELVQVNEWPLADYEPTGDTESHGITGFSILANGQIVFETHTGALWMLTPAASDSSSQLERLGWMHPAGRAYGASLFCPTGGDMVYGFTTLPGVGYEWIQYDLETKKSTTMELDSESKALLTQENLLIYGSNTIDNLGRAYVVGWKKIPRGFGPIVLQIEWREP